MTAEVFKPKFVLKNGIQGQGIFTTVKIKKDEILFEMSGKIIDRPTQTSIQVGKDKHIEDDIGIHVNHHCTPNARVDQNARTFISLRDIGADEEITFDYNANEDVLAQPFQCYCCHKKILGKLAGKIKA